MFVNYLIWSLKKKKDFALLLEAVESKSEWSTDKPIQPNINKLDVKTHQNITYLHVLLSKNIVIYPTVSCNIREWSCFVVELEVRVLNISSKHISILWNLQ